MLLNGIFEFRGVEKRHKKDGGCYVLAHFETMPFDGYLHNFLLSEDATKEVESLEKGDHVMVHLEYNDLYKSFKAVSLKSLEHDEM